MLKKNPRRNLKAIGEYPEGNLVDAENHFGHFFKVHPENLGKCSHGVLEKKIPVELWEKFQGNL